MTFSKIGDLLTAAENNTPKWQKFLNDADEFFSKIEKEDERRNEIDKNLSSKDMLEWLSSTVIKTKNYNNILYPDLSESELDQALVHTNRIKTAIKHTLPHLKYQIQVTFNFGQKITLTQLCLQFLYQLGYTVDIKMITTAQNGLPFFMLIQIISNQKESSSITSMTAVELEAWVHVLPFNQKK